VFIPQQENHPKPMQHRAQKQSHDSKLMSKEIQNLRVIVLPKNYFLKGPQTFILKSNLFSDLFSCLCIHFPLFLT